MRRRLNSKINICTYLKPINYAEKLVKLNKKKEDLEIKLKPIPEHSSAMQNETVKPTAPLDHY